MTRVQTGRSKQKVLPLCQGKYLKRRSNIKKPYKNPLVETRRELCHLGYAENDRAAKCTLMVIGGKPGFPI